MKQKRKQDLKEYREIQAQLAIHRDGALCAIHYFRDGKRVPGNQVHHVYGRSRRAGDWRESYKSLLCTCIACHPLPIQIKGASPNLDWVEEILEMANADPINHDFCHPEDAGVKSPDLIGVSR